MLSRKLWMWEWTDVEDQRRWSEVSGVRGLNPLGHRSAWGGRRIGRSHAEHKKRSFKAEDTASVDHVHSVLTEDRGGETLWLLFGVFSRPDFHRNVKLVNFGRSFYFILFCCYWLPLGLNTMGLTCRSVVLLGCIFFLHRPLLASAEEGESGDCTRVEWFSVVNTVSGHKKKEQ